MTWNKDSDWLPLNNALAQVVFWKEDLQKAEKFVSVLDGMRIPENHFMYKLALADIIVSKKGLARSQSKLKNTLERINS